MARVIEMRQAMEYPARFIHDKEAGGYVVSFPDVPEAHTHQGGTIEEATRMAEQALELALTFYTDKSRDLPVASAPKPGTRMVRIPALSDAKFKLYSALRAAGVKKIELARRLKCCPSQVHRLLNIQHASRLDQIEAAFAAIGKRLSVQVDEAA
jgi:antitoxin HicB